MAVKKELIIEIAPDGSMRIKTEGFKGAECEEELKPIEKALGEVSERVRTNDYYQRSTTQQGKITRSTK